MITVIPAIDIMNGSCVRLTEGDFNTKKVYYKDPLDAAKLIEDAGLSHLHLVDLDNAKKGGILSLKTLERIAALTSLRIDYGGGIKTTEDLELVFSAGALQANCGSIALKDPELFESWLQKDPEKIILSADAKNGMVSTAGWVDDSTVDLIDFIGEKVAQSLRYVTSTDISKDGKLEGPAFAMYEIIRRSFPSLSICASGGIAELEDIVELEKLGIDRVIVGKAIYEGRIGLADLRKFEGDA